MKHSILIFLFLVGCGSSANLSKEFRDGEQGRIDAYLSLRADGIEFSPEFYEKSASVFNALPKDQQGLISAYSTIASFRDLDSSHRYTDLTFFNQMQTLIDADFEIAGRGNTK